MSKKYLLIGSIILLNTALVGCTLTQPPIGQETDCTRLKRQALYNQTNPNLEAGSLTQSQRDSLDQQLQANNCN